MLTVLRSRNFALLWTGGVISNIGDWVLIAALPFYLYERTGSALATSTMFVALLLPSLLFGSVAGIFVDRWDRRLTMLVADAARTILMLALLVVAYEGWIWLVYAVTFVEQSIGTFFGPARGALLPHLVTEEQLVPANALTGVSDNLARLIGPSLGGVLLATIGFRGVVFADSASYLASALAILLIRVAPYTRPAIEHLPGSPWRQATHEWVTGMRVVRADRLIGGLFLVVALAVFADTLLTGTLVPFTRSTLHFTAEEFGWILTGRGLGGLIGTVIVGYAGKQMPPGRLLAASLAALAVLLAALAFIRSLPLVILLVALAGPPAAGWIVAEQVILQTRVPDELRGRVMGTYGATASLLGVIGLIVSGALTGPLGPPVLVFADGAVTLAAAVLALAIMRPGYTEQPSRAVARVAEG